MKRKAYMRKLRAAVGVLAAAAMIIPAVPASAVRGEEPAGQEAAVTPVFQSAKNYGGAYTDAFQNVAYTKDGGYVAAGYTMGDSTDPQWTYHIKGTAHNNNDAVLVKFDQNHNLVWAHNYRDTGVNVFNDMTILGDGRIAVIGRSAAPEEVDSSKIKGVSFWVMLVDPDNPESYTELFIGGTGGDQG